MSDTDLLLTELRKAIQVEPGDYIVIFQEKAMTDLEKEWLGRMAEELWRNNIRPHAVQVQDIDAIRFVKVESPETLQVEEK